MWWPVWSQPSHVAVGGTAGRVIATNGSPFYRNSFTVGGDVSLYWQQCDSSRYWVRWWGYPYIGLRANYAHVWNSVAGDRLGVAGLMQHPLVGRLDLAYSVGLSFYTNPYSLSGDVSNIWIGSVVNCLIDFGLVYNLPLSGRSTAYLAGKVVHSSNGYLYKPNRGLNFLQIEAGVRYGQPRRGERSMRMLRDATFESSGHPFVMVSPGAVMSRYDPIDKIIYYPTYTVQLGYAKRVHPCFAYGASLDLSYNFSHRGIAPADEWPVYPALSLFVDNCYGPLVLRVGMAHYLAYYPLNWEQYYERLGLYYRIGASRRQMVGVGMKVHYDHIDFVEWSYIVEL